MSADTRYTPLLGRILIAVIYILSGFSKLTGPAATAGYIASAGLPLPYAGVALAVVVELIGGILLVVGYQTRIVALIMALFTVATAVFFHSNFADQNMFIHFFKNIAMAGGLLQVAAFGAGSLSLDASLARKKGLATA
ncbi:LysR family transcriptional regulator [Labrys miyagiensis]|uniref:LysR family transcriptional regulator n=1 Tax=Labrys miyagiensis TaxID=346912 RepID=A0ABQ6CG11_9HYPH|nr:DoxX family protein [Labrys miyagiensis]GLS19271.1 LysR family transcriptional regulator [Labrys miyagiensis]